MSVQQNAINNQALSLIMLYKLFYDVKQMFCFRNSKIMGGCISL